MNHSRFNIFLNPKNISIKDRGFNYGDGLFETILVKDSKILYLKEHVERLEKLLKSANIKDDASKFRRLGSARKLYNFDVKNLDNY